MKETNNVITNLFGRLIEAAPNMSTTSATGWGEPDYPEAKDFEDAE